MTASQTRQESHSGAFPPEQGGGYEEDRQGELPFSSHLFLPSSNYWYDEDQRISRVLTVYLQMRRIPSSKSVPVISV